MIRQLRAVMDSDGCAEGHGNLAMDTAGIPVQGMMWAVPCSPKGRGGGAGTGAMGTPRPRPAVSGGLGSAQTSLGSSSRCPPTSSVPGYLWDWPSLSTPSLVDQGTSWQGLIFLPPAPLLRRSSWVLLEPAAPSARQEGSSTGQKGLLEPRLCSGLRPSLSVALPSTHPVLCLPS